MPIPTQTEESEEKWKALPRDPFTIIAPGV